MITVDSYQEVIDKKTKFTDEQIVNAANNTELEELVITGLSPYLFKATMSACKNKRYLYGSGVAQTEEDILGDVYLKTLQCIRSYKPRPGCKEHSFYNYLSTAIVRVVDIDVNVKYRPVMRLPYGMLYREHLIKEGKKERAHKSTKTTIKVKPLDKNKPLALLIQNGAVIPLDQISSAQEQTEDSPDELVLPVVVRPKGCYTEDEENREYNDDFSDNIPEKETKIIFDGMKFTRQEFWVFIRDLVDKAKRDRKFTERDLSVLNAFLENPFLSYKEIANKLQIKAQRVEQVRRKLVSILSHRSK